MKQDRKPIYFNAYKISGKLLLLLIGSVLIACSGQNVPKQGLLTENRPQTESSVVNINTASVEDLEKLPHIGQQTAREIVEYREHFGKFRKPQHLLLVRGISDKKFHEIKSLIAVE